MRFKLRTLLLVMVGLSAYIGIACSPVAIAAVGLYLLTIAILPIATSGVLYARGACRAFWVGVAVAWFFECAHAPEAFATSQLFELWPVIDWDRGGTNEHLRFIAMHAFFFASGVGVVCGRWFFLFGQKESPAQPDDNASQFPCDSNRDPPA